MVAFALFPVGVRNEKRTRLRLERGFDVMKSNPAAEAHAPSPLRCGNFGVPGSDPPAGLGGAGSVTL